MNATQHIRKFAELITTWTMDELNNELQRQSRLIDNAEDLDRRGYLRIQYDLMDDEVTARLKELYAPVSH